MDWAFISTVIQTIETIAVLIALGYGWQQIKESRKETNLGAMWQIFSELSSEDANDARKYIYQNRALYEALSSEQGLADLPEEARHNANKVGNNLDRVGYAVAKGLIPEHLLLDGYHYVIARSWIALEPYIQHVRIIRSQNSYMKYFQFIAERTFAGYVKKEAVKFTE